MGWTFPDLAGPGDWGHSSLRWRGIDGWVEVKFLAVLVGWKEYVTRECVCKARRWKMEKHISTGIVIASDHSVLVGKAFRDHLV